MRPLLAGIACAAIPILVAPAPAALAASGSAGTPVCTVTDDRLRELSGLVATADGYITINDSNYDASAMRIYYLDTQCEVTGSISYPSRARDPEDLTTGPDGSLWVADTGDNYNSTTHRDTVAVWHLAPGETTPTLYRLAYPDGNHDCEALLIDGDGLPVLITKELVGSASLYKPAQALESGSTDGVPMTLVGRFSPDLTTTSNPYGVVGRYAVTGAAVSPDRDRIAVRTYADVYEFEVSSGDVVAALTSGDAEVTPVPDEPQGESIAYTADGEDFLTVSDSDSDVPILRYPGSGGDGEENGSESEETSEEAAATDSETAAGGSESADAPPRGLSLAGGRTTGIVLGCVAAALVVCLAMARRRPSVTGREPAGSERQGSTPPRSG